MNHFKCDLQEKAAKWKTCDGQMDGLTTNGVLVMHPRNGFSQDSKPGVWREISVCGNVFTLRETRSAQQRGKMVRKKTRSGKKKIPVIYYYVIFGGVYFKIDLLIKSAWLSSLPRGRGRGGCGGDSQHRQIIRMPSP